LIGGGIKWNFIEPIEISSSVTGNKAFRYGTDFASFSQEIKEIKEDEFSFYVNETNDLSNTTESA